MIHVPTVNEVFQEKSAEDRAADSVLANIVSTLLNEARSAVDRQKGVLKFNAHWMSLPYSWSADPRIVRLEVVGRLRDAGYTVTEMNYNNRPYGLTIEAAAPTVADDE